MEVLYLSSLTSDHLFSEFFEKGWSKGYVGQKYHGMFVKGLEANHVDGKITVLSTPPINHIYTKFGEVQGKVCFRYVPLFPVPVFKQVLTFLYSLFYALWWCLKNVAKKKVVVCSLCAFINSCQCFGFPLCFVAKQLLLYVIFHG